MNWIREHKFESHLTAFLLMVIPSAVLYFTLQTKSVGSIWALLGVVIVGNLLAMIIK
ncbi:MAG: hypothetical protein ISR58_08825 [Anaerolineales bacterium]|nr:hypothetical protein [Chloroflexota bacterium]MBL6981281.1 hypothetical protein [Anaerolineales bacterium]